MAATSADESPIREILADIERKKIAPVYFLCGERYPQEQVLSALRAEIVGTDENGLNLEILEARDDGASGILAAVRTVSMLGGARLVVVRDAHQIPVEHLERLLPYLADPSPGTCLVLLAEKADTRLKFFKEVKKRGVLMRAAPLRDRQVPAWVTEEAGRRGIRLAPGAAQRIASSIGADMARLAMALDQLALYVGPGQPVTPASVEELLVETRERSIFELTNAVGRGQRREALIVLGRMLEAREPGVRIVSMLARHLRQLWSATEMSAGGLTNEEIGGRIGVHPYFVRDLVQQANRMGERALRRMHRAVFETDRALKSSRLPDGVILERLVLSLCPGRTHP